MGTNCAPFVADLFPFCYERDFMKSLTKEKRYDMIDAFNSTSRYLDDLLNINNIHFEQMVLICCIVSNVIVTSQFYGSP